MHCAGTTLTLCLWHGFKSRLMEAAAADCKGPLHLRYRGKRGQLDIQNGIIGLCFVSSNRRAVENITVICQER